MPRVNGHVKRFHNIILSSLCTLVKEGDEYKWIKFVKPLQADLNATPSKATMKSPIELLMGYKARTRGSSKLLSVIDVDIDLENIRQASTKVTIKRCLILSEFVLANRLKIGDFVMISQEGRRNKKLAKRYKVLLNDRYKLETVKSLWKRKPVMAYDSLKMWPLSSRSE